MVILSRELWLLLPPPLVETSSCSQISSGLSKLIDKTDVKFALQWKRLQHRNIIGYPSVFHQMTSLISAVLERAAFVVTAYVHACVCACVQVFFCAFVNTCLWICKSGCICACAVYMYLVQYKPNLFVFSLVWTCQQRLICHFFKSFKPVEHFSLWLTSTLTAQQEAPGSL